MDSDIITDLDISNNNESIDESIELGDELFDHLLKYCELKDVPDISQDMDSKALYSSYVRTLYFVMLSICTTEKVSKDKNIHAKIGDLLKHFHSESAIKVVEDLQKLSHKYRRTGLLLSVMKMFKTPKYDKYTDLECHAELLYMYSLTMGSIALFTTTHSVYDLIKVVFRLQKFTKCLANCKLMFKMKENWNSEKSKNNFEAGIRLANGVSHLSISNVPAKILRVINFLGYNGIETIGWNQINKAAFELSGVNSQLARIFLLIYWTWIQPQFQLGPNNLDICSQTLAIELKKYPKNLMFLIFEGHLNQINGRIETAIKKYKDLENDKTVDKSRFYINYNLMFCYALQCNWNESIKYAELNRKDTQISPAYFTYAEAVLRYAKSLDENSFFEKQKASDLFAIVPNLRIRHLGKTLTPEKVAVLSSEKYSRLNEFLILPEVEMLYQFNWLSFIRGDQILLKRLMDRIDVQINKYKDDIKTSDYLDNYLSALFYKAVIYRLLAKYKESKDLLIIIFDDEPRIGREFSIPPQTCLELGLIELELNNREESVKWLNKCVADYTGYPNENYVHLRAFSALRELGVTQDKRPADDSKLQEYKKQWLKDIKIDERKYESILEKEEIIGQK